MELRRLLGDFVLAEAWFEDLRGIMRTLHIMHRAEERGVAADAAVKAIVEPETQERLGIALLSEDFADEIAGFVDVRNRNKSAVEEDAAEAEDTAGTVGKKHENWILFTDIFADEFQKRQFERAAQRITGNIDDILHISREDFIESIIEYFSTGILNGFLCDCDMKERVFYSKERIEALKKVLSDFIHERGIRKESRTVEICCGDGAATIALHDLGISPLTADINKCEVCRGLREGVLNPKRSVVLNCAHLSHFFPHAFECVFGFMLGKITPFNMFEWEPVIRDIPNSLKNREDSFVFLTFSSEWEAQTAEKLLQNFECEIYQNEYSDGYFDYWILEGVLKR